MNRKNARFYLFLLATSSLCTASAFAAAPTITSFSPAQGALGGTVTFTGTNFVAPVTVSFSGSVSTSVTVVSSTTVKATVPPTASTNPITIVTAGGQATTATAFTILPGVSSSVAVGPPTTALTLAYSGFSSREPVDFYFDTEDIALGSASSAGAGNVPFTIPADAHPGSHWITAIGRRSINSSQIAFTVRSNWPQYDFGPNLKGKNRYENVLSAATVGDLDEAWRTPKLTGMNSAPVVVNGIVYADFYDGTIRAFNETTGAQLWSYQTGGTYMESSPAVSNGIVYVGSTDYYLYALDAVSGVLKWRFATGLSIVGSPNVANGIVYFGSNDDNEYALNATTGAVVWTFNTGGAVATCPMVANGVVYIGSYDSLYALNATTGAMIWSYAAAQTISFSSSPVILGGLICVGSDEGIMHALYASTGVVDWTYDTGTGAAIGESAAAVGGSLFFGCYNGTVYSVDSSGAMRWKKVLAGSMSSAVCAGNGVVYASNGSNTYALDENSGTQLATLPVGTFDGGPVVVDGAVFTGDYYDGVLTRYTLNALQSGYVAPRPDPMQLRPHHLR